MLIRAQASGDSPSGKQSDARAAADPPRRGGRRRRAALSRRNRPPMSEAGEAQSARSPSACAKASPFKRFIAAISAARAARRNACAGGAAPIQCGRPCARSTWANGRRASGARSPRSSRAYAERGADLVHYRPPGGESFADLAARVLPCWREIVGRACGRRRRARRTRRRQSRHPLRNPRHAARKSVSLGAAPGVLEHHRMAGRRAGSAADRRRRSTDRLRDSCESCVRSCARMRRR